MASVANNASFAQKAGVPKSVGQEFMQADKGIKFKGGQQTRPDLQKANSPKTNHGKLTLFNKGGDTMASKMNPKMMAMMAARKKPSMPVGGRMGADNQMMQAGAPQPGTPGMPMKKGGMAKMAKGGMAKDDMAKDKKVIKKAVGMHDKQQHGGKKTDLATLKKGGMAMKKMAGGGLAAGHKAADGVASKGKTKGTMIKMSKGGRYC
jgi:hypothetical protein